MIYLNYVGVPKHKRNNVVLAMNFAIKKLFPRHKNLDFEVRMSNLNGVYGYCYPEGGTMIVELDRSLKLPDLFSTIFHEMTHARQFIRKELCMEGKITWKGKVIRGAAKDPGSVTMPWEKEAYANEMVMFLDFFEQCDNKYMKGRLKQMASEYQDVIAEIEGS